MTDSTKADGAPAEADKLEGGRTPNEVVALKSADVHATSSGRHVKQFVLGPGVKPTNANGYDHAANEAATIQYMISQGLRPTGDVKLDSIKQHKNGVSWVLTYSVPAEPAGLSEYHPEADIVTGGEDVSTNTTGNGTSNDTTEKTPTPLSEQPDNGKPTA